MKIFGQGGLIDFSVPDASTDEAYNSLVWGRLAELGIATEEYKKAMEENPEPGDREEFIGIAVDEAEHASRTWWQKLGDCF